MPRLLLLWMTLTKVTMANLALLKRADCGHYVLANTKPNFCEVSARIVHNGNGATVEKGENYIVLCDECAGKIKPSKFWNKR